jgi:hypothetical protein
MFATYQNLVKEVLDELLLQRPGGEQAVKIGSEELGDEVTERSADTLVGGACVTYMSSNGEMKISLKLMIWCVVRIRWLRTVGFSPYVLVPQVLEQLQLAVGTLRKDRSAEGLHNLLDGHGLAGELILGRTAFSVSMCSCFWVHPSVPDETKGSHAHRLQIGVSGCC